MNDVKQELAELGILLNAEKEITAPVLRALTGPIIVEQIPKEGAKRPTWLAKFTMKAVPVMAELARRKQSPTAQCLDQLLISAREMNPLLS